MKRWKEFLSKKRMQSLMRTARGDYVSSLRVLENSWTSPYDGDGQSKWKNQVPYDVYVGYELIEKRLKNACRGGKELESLLYDSY